MHLRVDQSFVFKANNLFHMYFEDALWYWSKKLKQIFIRLWWWLWMMARRRQAGVIKVSHWEHLPLKVQSSSGQVIPPTNSKLAYHPETAWPIHFLSKVSWLSKNKTNGRYLPFYFVSGPIFAVKSICNVQSIRRTSTTLPVFQYRALHYQTQGNVFLPNLYFKRDKIIKGPKFTKRTAEKRNGLTDPTILYKLSYVATRYNI